MKWSLYALLLGSFLDLLIGDPHGFPHPVIAIGKLISVLERFFRRLCPKNTRGEILAGGLIWFFTAAISTAVPVLLLFAAQRISVYLRLALESVMCWQILAAKSLQGESMKVYAALKTATLPDAQKAVSMIVGRDTERLDEPGVARAAVETVAENTSDGVIAPLFYLALGGAGLGFFYKAVNTMDSMLGYVEPPYKNIGLDSGEARRCVQFHPRAALGAFPAGGRRAFASGCQKRLADVHSATATSTQAPTLRRRSRCAPGLLGRAAGGRCVVPRRCCTKSRYHRRRAARDFTRRTSRARAGCCTRRRRWRSFVFGAGPSHSDFLSELLNAVRYAKPARRGCLRAWKRPARLFRRYVNPLGHAGERDFAAMHARAARRCGRYPDPYCRALARRHRRGARACRSAAFCAARARRS